MRQIPAQLIETSAGYVHASVFSPVVCYLDVHFVWLVSYSIGFFFYFLNLALLCKMPRAL